MFNAICGKMYSIETPTSLTLIYLFFCRAFYLKEFSSAFLYVNESLDWRKSDYLRPYGNHIGTHSGMEIILIDFCVSKCGQFCDKSVVKGRSNLKICTGGKC